MTIDNSIQTLRSLVERDERRTLKIREDIAMLKGLPRSNDDVFVNTLRDEFKRAFCDEFGLSPDIFKEEFSKEFVASVVDPTSFEMFIKDVR